MKALVDHFCAESRLRIEAAFRGVSQNNDRMGYRLAQGLLKGDAEWLRDGILEHTLEAPVSPGEPKPVEAERLTLELEEARP